MLQTWFSYSYISLQPDGRRLFEFIVWNMSTTFGCKEIGIRKLKFVAKT